MEGDATRGTTTLVYLQLHISLYTGPVHVLSRVAGILYMYCPGLLEYVRWSDRRLGMLAGVHNTMLTGDLSSKSVGAPLGRKPSHPPRRKSNG